MRADKTKIGRAETLKLARAVRRVVSIRGKNVTTFDMAKDPPDDETLAKALLGPFGNLRAPVIRRGGMLIVGFSEKEYGARL